MGDGSDGAITIDVPRRKKKLNRRERRRRKYGQGEDVRQFWRGACLCDHCNGKAWPHIYVSEKEISTGRRWYGDRKIVLGFAPMSYECAIERNRLLLDLYEEKITSATGTTVSESAAAIAAAQHRGVKIKWQKVKRNRADERDTRKARESVGQVMLTASERKRAQQM